MRTRFHRRPIITISIPSFAHTHRTTSAGTHTYTAAISPTLTPIIPVLYTPNITLIIIIKH
jgi:hypothetical protein